MRGIAKWMSDHGFTAEDLARWHVTVREEGKILDVPVYDMQGTVLYRLYRYFGETIKYDVKPKGARRGLALYGMPHAVASMHREREAVIVEGFSDTIAAHKSGVTNTVGILTASIGPVQVATVNLFADTLIVIGDGDEAGEKLARSVRKLRFEGKAIGVVLEGYDPAEYVAAGFPLERVVDTARRMCDDFDYVVLAQDASLVGGSERGDGYR